MNLKGDSPDGNKHSDPRINYWNVISTHRNLHSFLNACTFTFHLWNLWLLWIIECFGSQQPRSKLEVVFGQVACLLGAGILAAVVHINYYETLSVWCLPVFVTTEDSFKTADTTFIKLSWVEFYFQIKKLRVKENI